MRTRFKTIMRGCRLALLLAVSAISASVSAQEQKTIASETIYVTFDKTKHIVLPSQVSNIRFGREDFIVAERVESVPNIVRITAQEEKFSGNTNLAIICDDGSVYSYDVRYLPQGREDLKGNIIYASGNDRSRLYDVCVNMSNSTQMFFPTDIIYCKQGNEEAFGIEYYNNMLTVGTTFENFPTSNLFVVDKEKNCYEITLRNDNATSYVYYFDDGRRFIAHVDVNSIEMDNLIRQLHEKKRNIFSVGTINNRFEMSLANLYVYDEYIFFAFDIKNFSNIDYDVDFLQCYLRDEKKSKKTVQQDVPYEPVDQKDFSKRIKGKSENRFVLAFNKFTIPDDKLFVIEMFEKNGGRHMQLSIENSYILAAENLKNNIYGK